MEQNQIKHDELAKQFSNSLARLVKCRNQNTKLKRASENDGSGIEFPIHRSFDGSEIEFPIPGKPARLAFMRANHPVGEFW